MNKVIFICLLSLSMCYSLPADATGKPVETTTDHNAASPAKPTQDVVTPPKPSNETNKASEPAHVEKPLTTKVDTTTVKMENVTASKNTTNTPADSKKEDKPEKTTTPAITKSTTTVKPEEKPTAKPDVKPDVKPDAKPDVKPDVTTPKAGTTVHPTATPSTDDKKDVVLAARGFDGASFIGGMILTVGLLAVGFIGFKYYKNHAERNYHTL